MIMIGDIIGKYKIENFIGSGGMAQVYRAHDTNTGKVVAIKILKEEFRNDAEFVRRFEREARAGLALSHDNIVRSLDVGHDHGMNYIVFEYISGKTLKEYIHENGKISPKAAVNFTCQILDALSHAHERAIIHRDVKPQNVMITDHGVAKLADFGIARDAAASTKTFTGSDVLGSVHYISPEQARGVEVTQQSDLYSVAIMLYEMLTGSVPFDSENSVSVALKHLSEDIQPPIELNSSIPPALNDVILKAAAKDPAMRYSTANQMKRDLIKSLNQPNGRFARPNAVQTPKEERKADFESDSDVKENKSDQENTSSGAKKIVIALGAMIAVLLIIFLIVTVSYNSTHLYVPNLLGDTYEEALEKVGDDFAIEITSKVESNLYPSAGHIITQDPSSGSRANAGTTIRVTVSIDSEEAIMPDLTGKSLIEANTLISKSGLVLAGVEYSASAEGTEGLVYDQEPKVGADARRGTGVVIYISGEAPESETVPNVLKNDVESAVAVLQESGFNHIIVRYTSGTGQNEEGTVFAQDISSGIKMPKDVPVILSVYGEMNGQYTSDRAYNVSIAENDTAVMATIVTENGYEVIVFESVFSPGTQTASFTAHVDEEGTYPCVLYINGVEDRREDVRFRDAD